MKILLVALNSQYIHSNPALFCLKAYAGAEYANQIEIAEYTINHRREDILCDIYKRQPDVIAVSCYIWNITMVKELLLELHCVLPEVPLWLGGPEASYEPKKLLQSLQTVTGIMVGEGERTFQELCRLGQWKVPSKEIKGLIYRDQAGNLIETENRELTNLSEIPFIYQNMTEFENRIVYYESSRGCPFSCSYCLSSIDKSVRFRDLSLVKKELQFFLDHKVPQVKFVDRTFNCLHTHCYEIWKFLKEHDNGVTNFHFEISGDILTDEEIELLKSVRPGLFQLEVGVQSTNEQTIHAIHRTMNLHKLEKLIQELHKETILPGVGGNYHLHIHLDLIAGLPYEDIISFQKSFDEIYALKAEQLQLGFLKVLKGSNMYENASSYGIIYSPNPPYEVLYTDWLTYQDVTRLKAIEDMVETYYNSNRFHVSLSILESYFEGGFALYKALADFYEKRGYKELGPSRVRRYEILLEFFDTCSDDSEKRREFLDALAMDLYLCENRKSRPDFCNKEQLPKEQIREFYKKEEETRALLPEYVEYDAKQLSRMTHIEYFRGRFWLFDYQRKSSLTGECTLIDITEMLDYGGSDEKKNERDTLFIG